MRIPEFHILPHWEACPSVRKDFAALLTRSEPGKLNAWEEGSCWTQPPLRAPQPSGASNRTVTSCPPPTSAHPEREEPPGTPTLYPGPHLWKSRGGAGCAARDIHLLPRLRLRSQIANLPTQFGCAPPFAPPATKWRPHSEALLEPVSLLAGSEHLMRAPGADWPLSWGGETKNPEVAALRALSRWRPQGRRWHGERVSLSLSGLAGRPWVVGDEHSSALPRRQQNALRPGGSGAGSVPAPPDAAPRGRAPFPVAPVVGAGGARRFPVQRWAEPGRAPPRGLQGPVSPRRGFGAGTLVVFLNTKSSANTWFGSLTLERRDLLEFYLVRWNVNKVFARTLHSS